MQIQSISNDDIIMDSSILGGLPDNELIEYTSKSNPSLSLMFKTLIARVAKYAVSYFSMGNL